MFSFGVFVFVVCVGVCRRGDVWRFVWWGNEGRVGTDRLYLVYGVGSECGGWWRGGVSGCFGWWVDYGEWGRAGPRGLD